MVGHVTFSTRFIEPTRRQEPVQALGLGGSASDSFQMCGTLKSGLNRTEESGLIGSYYQLAREIIRRDEEDKQA